MPITPRLIRPALITATALALSACAGTYTGPVEVTRFVAQQPALLGQGTITIDFPEVMENQVARDAFAAAVAGELADLGYDVVLDGSAQASNLATIRTSRSALAAASSRGPVSVGVGGGVGGGRGGFGSGAGVGIGINLGGGKSGPNILSELSVRISGPDGASLWEGRAQLPTSIDSPYSDVDASARTLAAALFADFPGGNGETVTIDVDDLQE